MTFRFQRLRTDPEVFQLAQAVALERQVPLTNMLRHSRGSGRAASARQLAIYLSHVLLERPQDVVATLFHRKRTTVTHAVSTMEMRRDDPKLEAEIARIEAALEMRHAA
jgi:chromosomal replication initiation ATPase DnaA